MLSKKLLNELNIILVGEYDLRLSQTDLEKFATNLVGLFTLLAYLDKVPKVR